MLHQRLALLLIFLLLLVLCNRRCSLEDRGSDDELLSDVFVGGVSLCIYVVAHFCLLMATVYFLIL